jgi:hypothetical protein
MQVNGLGEASRISPAFPPAFPSRISRCLTLEDAVEFFNLVQVLRLSKEEKTDLVAFLRQL